ncbi:MAG TPA: hypothetical protein VM115_07955 [Vicinamibacterales bacterium]|nr:hypothetical protein [Vicinamibacterales bacterium]
MKVKQIRKINATRSPHHRVVYANNTQITVSNVDIRLRFGVIEKASAEVIDVEQQVDVILGPVEMAALHDLLGRYLGKFQVEMTQQKTDEAAEDEKAETPA